ncbi:MAG: murein biosynthesis integral membrane protein MurJ [Armatimonadota bacterium]
MEKKQTKIKGQSLASAAVLMVVATLGSRIAGLVRVMVLARFGTEGEINAYYQAFSIPDVVYFLIAGGALRTGFVPVFTEYLATDRVQQAWKTFSSLLWLLLIFGGGIVALGVIFAPTLARWISPGWVGTEPELLQLCARIMQIIFPAQICFVLGGLLMGSLNAQKHFLWPAMGPIVYNLFIISGALLALTMPQTFGLETIAYAVLLGALCGNVLLQVPPLIARDARLQRIIDFRDRGVQRVVKLALPVVFGLAVAEINYLVIRAFATNIEQGPAIMEFANRLWKLPAGVVGAGIAIALFPTLAEHYAKDDEKQYLRDFSFGMRNTMFLTVPAAIVLGVMSGPIVRLLMEYGAFDTHSTQLVGQVMYWFAPGIVALSALYIVARAFYARHDTTTPLIVGTVSVAVCVGASFLLLEPMGLLGLAAAMTLSTLVNTGLLMSILRARVGQIDGSSLLASALRSLPGNLFLGAVCFFGPQFIGDRWAGTGFMMRLTTVFVPLVVGAAGFIGLAALFRVRELSSAWRLIVRRFARKKRTPEPTSPS